jgi:uncharacterized protein involved in exopolysaccharide biosynthesis
VSSIERVGANGEEQIDLIALSRIAWSHKWLIAATIALFGAGALVLALLATPIYRAEIVLTEVRDRNMGAGGSLTSQLGGLASLAGVNLPVGDGTARESQAILQSRHLSEVFIARHKLLPVIFPDAKKPPTAWSAVQRFRGEVLDVREDIRKGTTTIGIEWSNPAVAARWANDYVALANELIRSRALSESNRNIAYLNEQIARTRVIEIQRVMYNLIEAETKTLMLANGRPEYAFTVVDPAVPPELRISPKRTLMVLVGLFFGLVAGLVVVFVRHGLRQPVQDRAA